MRKICVIGNSHVAAVKLAYDNQELLDNISFYAIPGAGAPNFVIDGNQLVPLYEQDYGVSYPANLSKGDWVRSDIKNVESEGLSIQQYDAIFYLGVGLPAYRTHLKNSHHYIKLTGESPCNHTGVVSESCFKAIFHHELMNTCNIQSLERLIAQFDRPIFISMAPIPSQDVLKQNDFPKWLSNPKQFLAWCYQMQKRYLTERFIATGKARWLFDEETGADEWHFTDKKYAAKTDAWHMEQRYGDFVLSKISDKLVQL